MPSFWSRFRIDFKSLFILGDLKNRQGDKTRKGTNVCTVALRICLSHPILESSFRVARNFYCDRRLPSVAPLYGISQTCERARTLASTAASYRVSLEESVVGESHIHDTILESPTFTANFRTDVVFWPFLSLPLDKMEEERQHTKMICHPLSSIDAASPFDSTVSSSKSSPTSLPSHSVLSNRLLLLLLCLSSLATCSTSHHPTSSGKDFFTISLHLLHLRMRYCDTVEIICLVGHL